LADEAKISIQYVRAIEGGYGAVSDEVKQQLADALRISVWALFPDVKREVNTYNVLLARHGQDLKIRDAEVAMFKEVLSKMTEDEFEELIRSGTTAADVHRIIRTFAKDHDIEVIKKG
jgi:transcriptional regulator with XRE-family HTH domain